MAVDEKEIVREIKGLPEQAIYEVIDFIRFLRFKTTEPEQGWFWTEEWQKKEKEADVALAEGRFREFDNPEEGISWLNR